MAHVVMPSGAREIRVRARVVRANGQVEDLGTISYWHKSAWKRFKHGARQWFRKFKI